MQILVKNARLAFWNGFEARAFSPGQEPRYSCILILPKNGPVHKEAVAAMRTVRDEKWSQPPKNLPLCLQPGTAKDEYDGFDDSVVFISCSTKVRPTVVDRHQVPLTQEDGVIYSGCYVNAFVKFWAQDNKYGKRINGELGGVQFVRDGEPFTAGGKPVSPGDFEDLGDDDEDATEVPAVEEEDDLLG